MSEDGIESFTLPVDILHLKKIEILFPHDKKF